MKNFSINKAYLLGYYSLKPRRLLLCYSPLQLTFSGAHDCLRQLSPKTVNKKSVSAASASLKIGYTSLKVRNLSPFHSVFKQTDFLHSVRVIPQNRTNSTRNGACEFIYAESPISNTKEIADNRLHNAPHSASRVPTGFRNDRKKQPRRQSRYTSLRFVFV